MSTMETPTERQDMLNHDINSIALLTALDVAEGLDADGLDPERTIHRGIVRLYMAEFEICAVLADDWFGDDADGSRSRIVLVSARRKSDRRCCSVEIKQITSKQWARSWRGDITRRSAGVAAVVARYWEPTDAQVQAAFLAADARLATEG